ncbi:MAG: DUF368 domain-containing protein [Bryobacterales bacterium]|nr:DUF368 domain-containing protein [Bryobacterales bacterium]
MPRAQVIRSLAGGGLMGLANLVPGVSGGTMLLAAGVYPQCVDALARVTTLRPDRQSVGLLLAVAGSAALVILLLAGLVKSLVVEHRWAMYSLFLGSTLGGIPVLWRLIEKPEARTWAGSGAGLAAMVATSLAPASAAPAAEAPTLVLFLAGFGAFAAMMLPGLSGGYLLVLSGQYITILGAIEDSRDSLLAAEGPQWATLTDPLAILAPFALGCLTAVVGVSSLIRLLLLRQRAVTLGFLLGLLGGAVLGLWPFESDGGGPPLPDLARAVAAIGLVTGGFVLTSAIGRFGRDEA